MNYRPSRCAGVVLGMIVPGLWQSAAPVVAQPATAPVVAIAPVHVAPVAQAPRVEAPLAQGVKVAPVAVAPLVSVDASRVKTDEVKRAGVLLQLQTGALSPEEAWQSGVFGEADVRHYFQYDAGLWIIQALKENRDLNLALEALLVERGQTNWAKLSPPQLHQESKQVRLWVGDYFVRQHNQGVATRILESILDEYKEPVADYPGHAMLHQVAERIGWMQRDAGDLVGAARTFERPSQLMADIHNDSAGDTLWEAVRLYLRVGKPQRAQEVYTRLLETGSPFYYGLGILYLGSDLIENGHYAEARAFLDTPIEGKSAQAEIVRIYALCYGVWSSYKQGDFKKVRELMPTVLARYSAFRAAYPKIENDQGLYGEVEQAKLYLTIIDMWKKVPLIVETQSGRVPWNKDETGNLTKRISLRTFRPSKFTLKTEAPYLKAALTNGGWTGERRHYSEQEVTLTVDPTLLPAGTEDLPADVVVTMQGGHPFELRVPLTISRK